MHHVLILIADPAGRALDSGAAAAVVAALEAIGATTLPADWLAPNAACDIAFDGVEPAAATRAARRAVGAKPIDVAAIATAGRRKKLLIADMESTIIANEMIDELAALTGRGADIAEITRRAMAGELDFAASLRQRVGRLAGVPQAALERAAGLIRVTPGATALVATMAAHGATSALVSGGFEVFAGPVAARLGFDEMRANRLIFSADALSGAVHEPILDAAAKRRTLIELVAARGIVLADTLAVGDGANDLAMLTAAGLGVAYHAKPRVAESAAVRIDHADLTALLYLQGYRAADIIAT